MHNPNRPLSSEIKAVLNSYEHIDPVMRDLITHWMKLAIVLECQEEDRLTKIIDSVERYEHTGPFLVVDNTRKEA